jgi:hypothetical protein
VRLAAAGLVGPITRTEHELTLGRLPDGAQPGALGLLPARLLADLVPHLRMHTPHPVMSCHATPRHTTETTF